MLSVIFDYPTGIRGKYGDQGESQGSQDDGIYVQGKCMSLSAVLWTGIAGIAE